MPPCHAPFALLLLAVTLSVNAQPVVELAPKAVKRSSPVYETISHVTEGPAYGHTDGTVRGRYHRVLVLNQGLAYDRPTLRIETLTYGDEVCCRRVVGAWSIDLEDLSEKGVPLPDSATTELRFLRWRGPRTVEFAYGALTCRFAGIGKDNVTAACKQ